MSRKEYLGDSVYVEVEDDMLKLTTDNGYGPSNTIYLDGVVYQELVDYYERLRAANKGCAEPGGSGA